MNTRIFAVALLVFLFGGCGAFYSNEKQYNDGDWYGLAGSHEVARIKSDKLALEKLKQSDNSDAQKIGYRGTIYNSSAYRYANVIVTGPERKGFYIKPQEKIYYNFIPGTYVAALYDDHGNIRNKPWVLHVGLQKHYFMGEEVHWYLVSPP